jgi:hypothetical protein
MIANILKNETKHVFTDQDTVQVLALDGGGLKGLFSASVVKSIENQLGHSICDHFDIVTGTSTGGLIALALSLGRSGKEIQQFYVESGHKIFPCGGLEGALRKLRWAFYSKYSNKVLKSTLLDLLCSKVRDQPILGDSLKRLVIPTFRAGESIPRLLKTPHAERYRYDWRLPMWAVGLATSAAPTYLPSFSYDGKTYLDGGLWANNPSLVGLVEAKDLGAEIKNIKVLNIGTTFSNGDCMYFYPLTKIFRFIRLRRGGIISWGKQILPTVMQANSYATANMYLHQLLGPGNYCVINKQIDDGDFDLDRIDNSKFIEMGESAGEMHFSKLGHFFKHKAHPYIPNQEAMSSGE